MKTTIKEKLKSSYQGILDYFSWLLADENKKENIYENDEDVVEEELAAFIPISIDENTVIPEPISIPKVEGLKLTKKQQLIYDLIPKNVWVTSTFIGNLYCDKVYVSNAKEGRSQYSSKTLNQLVILGLVEKNNKRQYKTR
jgi:hypothetical protein